ncbi:ABC transporter permease protein (plasmid) [Rhizobium etli 8C-3]|uniref:ABC transporter permease protein n=2 Tax=Rhizobium TaxID=379 RepID=A0A1L5PCG0_RHIET|nr:MULTISPECIES: ABC transporter permease [Rhizobium]APO77908.1 ABC transporter permease protein [Rhizobium etli 8C-3]TCU30865.1 putative spermidine/putrescine transport system permease protein/spermidine/putrescine transport system permease protein [Rhizobium azibense]
MSDPGLLREQRRERLFFVGLAWPAIVIVGVSAMAPIFWILGQSFQTVAGEATLGNYDKILSSGLTWSSLGTTLALSLSTLIICVVLGVPLALALASANRRVANRVLILIMLPLWTSILVRTYGWLVLLRRDGLVNSTLAWLGVIDQPLPLVYNFTGALIGMTHYMLPLFVLPVYAAMRDIDGNVVRAAASLGAGFWRCVATVILPLASGGLTSGSMIVFIYTLGFFITPAVLGGGKVNPIAIRIERTLSTFQDWGGASALGMLLLLLILIAGCMFAAIRRLAREKVHYA